MSDFDFFKSRWQPLRPVFDCSLVTHTGSVLTDNAGKALTADDGVTVLTTDDFVGQTVIGNIVRFVTGTYVPPVPSPLPPPLPPPFVPRLDFSDKRDSQYIGPFGLP
jgi:hypothetical protein